MKQRSPELLIIKNRTLLITEYLTLLLLAVYLVSQALTITTFTLRFPQFYEPFFVMALFMLAAARVLILWKEKLLWASLCLAVVCNFVWGNVFQTVGLFAVCCVGISYKRILKVYLIAVGGILAVTVLAALSDGIINYVRIRGSNLNSSMGTCNTTDYASIVFMVLLVLWVYLDHVPERILLPIPVLSALNAFFIAGSRTSTICSFILGAMILFWIFIERGPRGRRLLKWLNLIVDTLLQTAFPVSAVSCFLLTYLYAKGNSLAYIANRLLSGRLNLMMQEFEEHTITAFGQAITQIGNGGSEFAPLKYTFIDVSYVLLLIKYGAVVFAVFLVLWPVFTHRALKAGNRRLAMALALISIHSFSEHHFPEPAYNIFLILPFAALDTKKISPRTEEHKADWDRSRIAICAALVTVELLHMPRILAGLRIIALKAESELELLAVVAAFLVLSFTLIGAVSKLLVSFLARQSVPKKTAFVFYGSVGLALLLALYTYGTIERAADDYRTVIEADRPAIETVISNKQGKLFAYRTGELYHEVYPEFDLSVFDGNDLARYSCATIVTEREHDTPLLTGRGYMYAAISDEHAVYSNDQRVIEALQKEGYIFTSYCTYENEIVFTDRAKWGGYPITDNSELLLIGDTGHSAFSSTYCDLRDGTHIDLYGGKYTVSYVLSIEPQPYVQDHEICRVKIDGYGGARTARDLAIYRSWFDERGEYTAKVQFSTSGYPNVSFSISVDDGQEVRLKAITWQRTPDYDVRPTYDQDHRKIRDDYYDANGMLTKTLSGYSSCLYHYVNQTLVDQLTYVDSADNPVNISNNYAIVKRSYNFKSQLEKEEFLDADGRPAVLPDGYSIRVYEYDMYGNRVATTYCDETGNPVLIRQGYARVENTFDSDCRTIGYSYYGIDGKPIFLPSGYAGLRMVYYEDVNDIPSDDVVKDLIYLDRNGKPVNGIQGEAGCTWAYNEENKIVKETYIDQHGNAVMRNAGYSSVEYRYDCAGNRWDYRYHGLEEEPVVTSDGYAEVRCAYDSNNLLVNEMYYGADGKACETIHGFARAECCYDKLGKLTGQRFYNLDGELVYKSDSFFWLATRNETAF